MGRNQLRNSFQNSLIGGGGENEMKIEKNSRQMPAIVSRESRYSGKTIMLTRIEPK